MRIFANLMIVLVVAASLAVIIQSTDAVPVCSKARPDFGEWAWVNYSDSFIRSLYVFEIGRGAGRSRDQLEREVPITFRAWQKQGCPGGFIDYLGKAYGMSDLNREPWAEGVAMNIAIQVIREGAR